MGNLYRSAAGEQAVKERYLEILKRWPIPSRQVRFQTRAGETFALACGKEGAPAVLLFHGGAGNSAMWIADIAAWAVQFRVYAVDMIGEAGFSAPSRPPLESDAHALWLDDVLQALSLQQVSIVGVSLGGWLALDYATRRPERIKSLVVLCPGGVGNQKLSLLLRVIPLMMCGKWGANKLMELILGRTPDNASPAIKYFAEFVSLIHENFRSRMVKMPVFSDSALKQITMPVMAILGGKDVILNSEATKNRLEKNLSHVDVRYHPEAGHFIPGQTGIISEFLRKTTLD